MENILIVFLDNLKDIEGFNKIVDEFDKRKYKMYLYDNIRDTDFDFSELPDVIEFYKNQHNNVNKIVILSNMRDLIFAWYRCFNSIADDFVYFIDEEENNYFGVNDRHFAFYYNLYEFNGIKDEIVEGKIYLSKKDKSTLPLFYEKKYFDYFADYNYTTKKAKKMLNKKYVFRKLEYCFRSNKEEQWNSIELDKLNKRIVLIKGQSQYDVLRILTDFRTKFYKELGFEAETLDLLDSKDINNINQIINGKCEFVFSSNCIGIDIRLKKGTNLYDALNVPFLGTLGDHPVNQLNRIINSPQKTVFKCLDKENIEYFKKYFPNKKIVLENSSGYPVINYKKKKFCERKIDVLFSGSLINPNEMKKDWCKLDKKTQLVINDLSDLAVKSKFLIDIDIELSKMFLKYNINNYNLDYRALIHSLVERYVRFYKRYKLIKKIGESDLSVVCVGNIKQFSKLNTSGKLLLKDKVDYETLLEMMNDSKIVLNMTGHLYNGITERVLSAMINGAAVVTEEDRFTRTHLKEGENIILYDCDTVVHKIKYYLKNIDELEKIALNGQKEAIKKYDYRISLCKLPRYVKFQ